MSDMIEVFYGADTDAVLSKSQEAAGLFQSKEPKATFVVFEDDSFDEAEFLGIVSGGQSLFAPRCAVLFKRVFDDPE
ncbi:MAG: hypothetical protein HZC03_01175, partial [Candidatus Lloydbacteria bacterium]|nr:hypothetical protein [Candidatus Lloydbacteria bacterium]